MVCTICPLCPYRSLRGNVGSLHAPTAAQLGLFTFGPKGAGDCTEMVVNGLKKSTKNRGSQCYHQSAHWAHTGDENGKCGFCGRF